MTRPTLLLLASLALLSGASVAPTLASSENIFITPDAHKLADQLAAITYARELIAAGNIDQAVQQLE